MKSKQHAVGLLASCFIGLSCLLPVAAQVQQAPENVPAQPVAPQAQAKPTPYRVIIVSIDGLRPDLMLRANTPNLHKMLDESAYSLWARSTAVSITLPSHVSMLTGVQPQVHGIMWNDDLPLSQPIYPKVPTIFELAKKQGYTTAIAAGKSKFDALTKPGTVDWSWIAKKSTTNDEDVAEAAINIIRQNQPDVMHIHFPGADNAGHSKGWSSPEQMAAIANIDTLFGKVLATLDELKLTEKTYIIVSADHGGSGKTHGADDNRSRTIPWILRGPNVRKGYDLTLIRPLDINTEDTFATACYLLKIPPHKNVEGKPVLPALVDVDLMKPSAEAK